MIEPFSTGVLVGALSALWLRDSLKRSQLVGLVLGFLAMVILMNAILTLGGFDSVIQSIRLMLGR